MEIEKLKLYNLFFLFILNNFLITVYGLDNFLFRHLKTYIQGMARIELYDGTFYDLFFYYFFVQHTILLPSVIQYKYLVVCVLYFQFVDGHITIKYHIYKLYCNSGVKVNACKNRTIILLLYILNVRI